MKYAPVDVVLGAVVFFYNLGNELLKSTIHYLENNKEFQNIVNNHNLEVNGVGIASFYALAQGDVRRFEDVSRLRLSVALTFLTFEKEKNEIETELIRSK
jgi:hypothetical protein